MKKLQAVVDESFIKFTVKLCKCIYITINDE